MPRKTATNPAPAAPMNTKGTYRGVERKISRNPMPRMMTAVLKLFVPTSATMGKSRSNTPIRERIFSIRPFFRSTAQASSKITATLANSAGWKDSGPRASHRLEPLYSPAEPPAPGSL